MYVQYVLLPHKSSCVLAVCCLVKLLCSVFCSCMGFIEGLSAFHQTPHASNSFNSCLWARTDVLVFVCLWKCGVSTHIYHLSYVPPSGRVSGVRVWWTLNIWKWGGPGPCLRCSVLAQRRTDAGNPVRFRGLHLHSFSWFLSTAVHQRLERERFIFWRKCCCSSFCKH